MNTPESNLQTKQDICLVAPHTYDKTWRSHVLKAYASKEHLPSGVQVLLSKTHSAMIGADINSLWNGPKGTSVGPMVYDERRNTKFKPMSFVVDSTGDRHYCERATEIELTGAYRNGYSMIRYNNGQVVVVKADRVRNTRISTKRLTQKLGSSVIK